MFYESSLPVLFFVTGPIVWQKAWYDTMYYFQKWFLKNAFNLGHSNMNRLISFKFLLMSFAISNLSIICICIKNILNQYLIQVLLGKKYPFDIVYACCEITKIIIWLKSALTKIHELKIKIQIIVFYFFYNFLCYYQYSKFIKF